MLCVVTLSMFQVKSAEHLPAPELGLSYRLCATLTSTEPAT